MLKGLFGSKAGKAARGEDRVWASHSARIGGVSREVETLTEAERRVLVVALTLAALDELCTALAAHQPVRCADVFAKEALRSILAQAGSVAIALSGALAADLKPAAEVAADILVVGRNDSRAADDGIVRFADALGPNAHIAFHLSLEDPLLQAFGGKIRPILEKLGMHEDEPITHAMVTRAIANAQAKKS
jgi:preprotein translocase subunit SecA